MSQGSDDPARRDPGLAVALEPRVGGPNYEDLPSKQLSQVQLVWIRFRRHRLAMVGTEHSALYGPDGDLRSDHLAREHLRSEQRRYLQRVWTCRHTFSSGLRYIFGSDLTGHSISAQIIYGARFSLLIGFSSAIAATLIGALVGAVSGYFGGWVDTVLMRIVDVFLTLPFLPVLLVAAGLLGGGHTSVLLVIGIFTFFGWAYPARLVRGLFLSLRTMEYAEAARAVGVSTPRIIFRHLLPNALRPILVATTLAIAGNIAGEAAIDFLGYGLQYPDTSWGSVLSFAEQEQFRAWWLTVFPGLFLVATIVAVNFLGDGLSDALDVRSK